MTWEVRIDRHADRALAAFPEGDSKRILAKMRALKDDPLKPRSGADIRRLQASGATYRLRVGNYRVFYVVFDERKVVVVTDVKHRSHAYD